MSWLNIDSKEMYRRMRNNENGEIGSMKKRISIIGWHNNGNGEMVAPAAGESK